MQVSFVECKQSTTIGIVKTVSFSAKFSLCFRYSSCWKDNEAQETLFQEMGENFIYIFSVLSILIFFCLFLRALISQ